MADAEAPFRTSMLSNVVGVDVGDPVDAQILAAGADAALLAALVMALLPGCWTSLSTITPSRRRAARRWR